MPDPNEEQIRKQRAQFIKAFEDLAEASANQNAIAKKQIELTNKLIEAVNKQTEVTAGLIDTLMMPKDGMRDVLDEVLDEIRGLREDIRIVAEQGGFQVMLRALLGRRPKT
jgi:phage regulator Rha-like protein